MKISIGADHAGYELKTKITEELENMGHQVKNYGTDGPESVDYPDFGHPVAKDVQEGKADRGVVICGSGNGINMTANKYKGVRSALCWKNELVELARQHNDANVLALPARYITTEEGVQFVRTFLNTEFEGGRHERRVNKIGAS